jgi:hypothetical protein
MDVQVWHLVIECRQRECDGGGDNDQLLPDQQTLTHDSNCFALTALGSAVRLQPCMREFAVIPSFSLYQCISECKLILKGKELHSQSREIISNVHDLMKKIS